MKTNENGMLLIKNKTLRWFVLSLTVLGFMLSVPVTASDLTGDPQTDVIPMFDYMSKEKAIVVGLDFLNPFDVSVHSVQVVPGPARARDGQPCLLSIELLDVNSSVIDQFCSRHPLWASSYDDLGFDSVTVSTEGKGRFVLPFLQNLAAMRVTDVGENMGLIFVDLIPSLHDFCRMNPEDATCLDIVNRPPVCDADGPYYEECAGPVTNANLDGTNCSDPDQDPLDYEWTGSFIGGVVYGAEPSVQFSGLGDFLVNLEVHDDFGGTDMCSSSVTIADTTAPEINCNAPTSITPVDAPISFQATAVDVCEGELPAQITKYDCYMFTKKGERIDKKDSCIVSIDGDTILIIDSGGIDNHVSWSITSADTRGNEGTRTCEVFVVQKLAK
jgi:hypothetical protein